VIGIALRLALRGVRDLAEHPWPHTFACIAVTLAAFLAGLFLLFLTNLDRELHARHGQVQFQVYWQPAAELAGVQNAWQELRSWPGVESVRTYTPDEALHELTASLDPEAELGWLKGKSPLPATALVSLAVPDNDPDRPKIVYERLKALPDVAEVHYNPAQMDMARSWLAASQRFLWPLIGLLGLVAGLIVGNTIKLSQVSRLDEVDILRLVGARQWYIELPMLAGGAAQGLAGSILGLGLLKLFQLGVANLLNVPPLFLSIEFLPWIYALGLAASLTLVGLLSSWVAVR
jgi:cell division transport system permease protein